MKNLLSAIGRFILLGIIGGLCLAGPSCAARSARYEAKPADAQFAKFEAIKAPAAGKLMLQTGDRLAICGDSITEQKMYSRIMETYLTVCVPELRISTRQYGWSGETAEGFRKRMENDCLRFKPTVATTCYGMNDYRYRPYDEKNAQWYRENYTAIVRAFKAAGAKVVLGSPGCVGKVASWVKTASGTLEEHNLSLCAFRNIDIDIAGEEHVRFADIFWPMFTGGFEARHKYGPDYAISGKDGVHPGWAGHLVMAYEFLKAMGLDGEIGTITVDLQADRAEASAGHVVERCDKGEVTILSQRYPFCAAGPADQSDSIRSGMTIVPFNQDLNRLVLKVVGGAAGSYKVTWGSESKVYSASDLAKGVNLAADFEVNPFSEAFKKVDDAVAAKQAYETKQVKTIFHGKEARADRDAAVAKTEAERKPLVEAIGAAFVPVRHTIKIEAQ
jgi:lysophospholipase L1-like esterase